MDAYALEKPAKVPRVIIDKSLSEIYSSFPSQFPFHSPTMEKGDDDCLYLRYLPFQLFPPYVPSWSDYLIRARQHIHAGLAHPEGSVRSKYAFAKTEFNFSVNFYRKFLDPAVEELA